MIKRLLAAFQDANGIKPSGTLDAETWEPPDRDIQPTRRWSSTKFSRRT